MLCLRGSSNERSEWLPLLARLRRQQATAEGSFPFRLNAAISPTFSATVAAMTPRRHPRHPAP